MALDAYSHLSAPGRTLAGMEKEPVVYFIQAGGLRGPVKIGFSRVDQLRRRLKDLQCGNHLPLSILGTVSGDQALEGQLHMLFENQRAHGEWFAVSPEMLGFIHDIADSPPAEFLP